MKEDREPWLHKLTGTQQRKNDPNNSGDTILPHNTSLEVTGDTFPSQT